MEEITGKTVSCINMVGGGIQDQLLCELTAKKTGKRVMAGPVEGSVLGNSIVQLVAMGEIKDVQAGRQIIRDSFEVKIYEPSNLQITVKKVLTEHRLATIILCVQGYLCESKVKYPDSCLVHNTQLEGG